MVPTMKNTRRLVPLAIVATITLAACGGSDAADDTTTTTGSAVVTEQPEDFTETSTTVTAATVTVATVAAETTLAEVADTVVGSEDPVVTTVGAAAAAGTATATMSEWVIEAPTEYAAGEITFTATNEGSFPHEFVVIEGESYEALPREEGGSIIEDDLPTGALLGRTPKISGGSSEDLTVTLAQGNYVLVCNLGGGENSHAAQGQRLSITVT